MSVSRRDVLKLGVVGTLGAAGLGVPLGQSASTKSASRIPESKLPKPYRTAFVRPPVLAPTRVEMLNGAPVAFYTVAQRETVAEIVPGYRTPLWAYNGLVPGPTIDVERGTKVSLKVRNKLPDKHPLWDYDFNTSTHLHGSASLPQFDGYANDLTHPDYAKTYEFPNFQDARTLWYHDHAVHHTGHNVYSGLAAQYHMHDALERSLLPQGEYDVPLTVSDVMFAADGNLAYDDNEQSGLWGDVILVNGRPWPVMKVARRIYRFRVLNASISRSYRFRLSTGDPVTVVATDGGLMPNAQRVTAWRHGMAERYEILVDFSKYSPGTRVELRNLSNKNNVDYDYTGRVMAFDVTDEPFDPTNNTIPTVLNPANPVMTLRPAQSLRGRRFRLKHDSDGSWTINGTRWADIVASGFQRVDANPGLGDVEIWTIENKSGGWFHPTHIHLVDFKILSRNGRPPFPYERGPKDTVYVGEGETVRLLMQFGPHRGRYMMHCHNLPHEDHDMMTQFSVGWQPGDPDPNDPLSVPCVEDYGD